ncbi:SIR2 family NAD-dependent protein deacylase [Pseudodesulfovibrio piezophilus]|uniref:NAD-dependent protein deacylase n=1 Tax=Pseudodesulfovibrio piezophilus (strain DSM 21447 / JCM 15486 / C1TLV30) TaxID=1322246 RepID=M1WJX4_PSEP2|nr:NAD-dependent deacylase [Pseudodesulfovibrio piezophilus]CCH48641.1 NAD-dependent deacetylase 1 [Pseudodesulfovibrio piezophilus C1TLV30]
MLGELEMVKAVLSGSRRTVVLTGAGISVESGVPTFRGRDGSWKNYRPEDLARPDAFEARPELVWEFYNWRRESLRESEPNAAHLALAEMERKKNNFLLITQNVDGLHCRAGSRKIMEMHGSLWQIKCTKCTHAREDFSPLPPMPECPVCGHLLRPGVVWFGEPLIPGVLRVAIDEINKSDVFLAVETSSLAQPAASFYQLAKDHGAVTVEINREPTPISGFMDFALHGKASDILPELMAGLSE